MNQNAQEKDIKKIIICYEDGSQKEIDKGMAIYFTQENEEIALDMDMCELTGQEVMQYLEYITTAYIKIKNLE